MRQEIPSDALRLTQALGIPAARLYRAGVYNTWVHGTESRVYIEPRLLRSSRVAEMEGADGEVAKHFRDLILLIAADKRKRGALWRKAAQRARFKEVRGMNIGWANGAAGGRGIGEKRALEIIGVVSEFVEAGIDDPRLFELLSIVDTGVGADLISDMIASILEERLVQFTTRVAAELGIECDWPIDCNGQRYYLPTNPVRADPIVFVPHDIVGDLPSFGSRSHLKNYVEYNQELRDFFNDDLAEKLGKSLWEMSKEDVKRILLGNKQVAMAAMQAVHDNPPPEADKLRGSEGEEIFAAETLPRWQQYAREQPVAPEKSVHDHVLWLCEGFRQMLEDNGVAKLLYSNGHPRQEKDVQNLFFASVRLFCEHEDIALSPEVNSGRGAVDFKFNRGFKDASLVEIKLSHNTKLVEGYERQLAEYSKAEKVALSVYLVVDFKSREDSLAKLVSLRTKELTEAKAAADLVIARVRDRPSASKL